MTDYAIDLKPGETAQITLPSGDTVPKGTVARRRAANRVARVSRRINRKRG